MTTIAWDNNTLAADSMCADEDSIVVAGVKKIHRAGDYIVGCCGTYEESLEFVDWVAGGMTQHDKPKNLDDDFGALVIDKRGKCMEFGPRVVGFPTPAPAAIGSGATAALAAMLCDADSKTAVSVASKLDLGTGGRIRTLTP